MPIRESATPGIQLYRSFRFGTLADLVMLDTRGLRDQQVTGDNVGAITSAARTLLGAPQERWLFDQLSGSQRAGTAWRLLGQQIMFSRLSYPGRPVPLADTWDGYQASRQRVLDFLVAQQTRDLVILAGDVHSSWAFDVPPHPWEGYTARSGAGSIAVELITPAVSSPPLFADPVVKERAPALRFALPHLKYLEGESRGYLLVTVTGARVEADWSHVPGVMEDGALQRGNTRRQLRVRARLRPPRAGVSHEDDGHEDGLATKDTKSTKPFLDLRRSPAQRDASSPGRNRPTGDRGVIPGQSPLCSLSADRLRGLRRDRRLRGLRGYCTAMRLTTIVD
jgi:alkaline phosphatase D